MNDFLIGTTASKRSRSRAFGARYMVSFLAFTAALPLISVIQTNWGFDGLFYVLMTCALIILLGSRVLLSRPSGHTVSEEASLRTLKMEPKSS